MEKELLISKLRNDPNEDLVGEVIGPFKLVKAVRGYIIVRCMFCDSYARFDHNHFDDLFNSHYRNGYQHNCPIAKRITSEYSSWKSMNIRCYEKTHPSYKKYGARGIVTCKAWKDSFELFLIDLGFKPDSEALMIREDEDDYYDSKTTKWATLVNGKYTQVSKVINSMALHTLYKFNDEWYCFWLVEYDYDRASKVLRTEQYQAPMTMLNGDNSFSVIKPAPDALVEKWLGKFGEKFGYQHARQVDNGRAEYLLDTQLPLESVENKQVNP